MHVITVLTSYFDLMHLGRKHMSAKCKVLVFSKRLSCFGVTIIALWCIDLTSSWGLCIFLCVCVCDSFLISALKEREQTCCLYGNLLKGDNKCIYPFFLFFICVHCSSCFVVVFVCVCGCVFQNGRVCSPLSSMSQFVRSHFLFWKIKLFHFLSWLAERKWKSLSWLSDSVLHSIFHDVLK